MSTIRRIGALMQVGFGSAGVEIIRNNLERGQHKDILFLNKQGTSVSCIFLFCDIRQFTDATESLQEEVFVSISPLFLVHQVLIHKLTLIASLTGIYQQNCCCCTLYLCQQRRIC